MSADLSPLEKLLGLLEPERTGAATFRGHSPAGRGGQVA